MMSCVHYVATVQLNFNRYACGLGTILANMPPDPLEIKEKSCLMDAPTSDMPANNVKLYQPRLLHCQYNTTYMICREVLCGCSCNIQYTPAGLVLLSPTPLQFKHAYCLSAAARWILAGLWPLNQHAC